MATIINNPDSGKDSGSGMGMLIGAIVLVLVLILFFVYGLPAIRGTSGSSGGVENKSYDINVSTPSTDSSTSGTTNQ